jgi:hypothetical protein
MLVEIYHCLQANMKNHLSQWFVINFNPKFDVAGHNKRVTILSGELSNFLRRESLK